jgi:mannose-6-phosphate isomerase-like protein (cupin superfamily)
MKAIDTIRSFSFERSILHVSADGPAALLQPPFVKAELAQLDGRILATFPIAGPADAHTGTWEMHPEADEVLFMLAGDLGVEFAHGPHRSVTEVKRGEGIVVPRGAWHRLHFRVPGLLMALTATRGTRSSSSAGERP